MQRKNSAGILFVLPWLVGFAFFFVWPFIASVYWSFCDFDLVNSPTWIGLQNYQELSRDLSSNQAFGMAVGNTVYYVALSVPLSIIIGVSMATLLSQPIPGRGILRTVVFLPSVLPVVAISVLWLWMLDPRQGWVNWCLSMVGCPPQNWLNQARSIFSFETIGYMSETPPGKWSLLGSKDGLIAMTVWGVGNYMVIYLAALTDIPRSLYEAIELDGAGPWRKFVNITLPMLSPVLFFHLVIGLIRGVQTFASVYILSEGTGEPGGSMSTISLQLFLTAFGELRLGYASAMAWIVLVFLSIVTFLLFRTSAQWVHYRTAT